MKRNKFRKTVLWLMMAVILLFAGCSDATVAGGTPVPTKTEENMDTSGQPTMTPTEVPTDVPEPELTNVPEVTPTAVPEVPEGGSTLEVHYLDIGQGDATLLVCDGEAMLIDAGENDKGTQIQNYLTHLGIKKLKYAIGTHPHSDHIGGLDVIIYKFDCETILMPDLERDMKTYQDVINAVEIKDYKVTVPQPGDTYTLGGAQFQIVAPNDIWYESMNDYSIALRVIHGDNEFLFTGDAEEESEKEMLRKGWEISADVYQVGHHGSYSSTSEAFIEEVSPDYAVISCGENNDYGHPHAEVMNRLRAHGVQVFRTDEQGTIVATSVWNEDGSSELTWNAQSTESWQTGEPAAPQPTKVPEPTKAPEPTATPKPEFFYILNNNTMKIHLPSCRYADTIADKNRAESTKSKEELEADGYVPCKSCIGK